MPKWLCSYTCRHYTSWNIITNPQKEETVTLTASELLHTWDKNFKT